MHHTGMHAPGGHAGFRDGKTVDHVANGFDPHAIAARLRLGHDAQAGERPRRARVGAVRRRQGDRGRARRVRFAAWTYNGRIPGPTLRCREGERLRITLVNGSQHPHTIHFHGIHPAEMDGVPGLGAGEIAPGGRTVYEFDALPAGLHLYHCHVAAAGRAHRQGPVRRVHRRPGRTGARTPTRS